MKKILLPILFSAIFAIVLSAQIDVTFDVNPVNYAGQVDLTDQWTEVVGHANITNNSSTAVSIKWNLQPQSNVPGAWEVYICDNNNCYTPSVISNIMPGILDAPVELQPGESGLMDVHVRPNFVAGYGTVMVPITTTFDTVTVLSTGVYNFDITGLISSTSDLEKSNIKVFPNPASTYFNISDNELVSTIEVYNVIGKKLKTYEASNGSSYDINDLPKGLLMVRMLDKDAEVVKTVRLTKE